MALILNIETSTTLCSVALAENENVIELKEIDNGYTHAENLHVFIDEVLSKAGVFPQQLNAISVGKGPGSYTGLRIGVSAAKGLAYALGLPLIAVNTLETMIHPVISSVPGEALFCPMLDARRMEVYCAIYDRNYIPVKETSAQIISEEDLSYFPSGKPIFFFGDGMPKCKSILSGLNEPVFIEGIKPSAAHLAVLSYERFQKGIFEDVAYFEPFYLKDFMIKK